MRTSPPHDAPLRMRRHRVLALVLAAALMLGACGGDDAAGPETTTANAETTAAPDIDTDSTAVAGTDDGGTTDTTPVDLGNIPAGDCAAMAMQWSQAMGGAMGGVTPSELDYDAIFDALDGTVPSELRGDVAVLADAYRQVARVMEEAGGDFMALANDPEALAVLESLDTPEMQAAGERVGTYFEDLCPEG